MTNNPLPPIVPGGEDSAAQDADVDATRTIDGEEVLDEDVNDDLVNSADADAIAADQEGESA
ncbi:hypothetical protein F6B41_21045 [Microbacterium lushaniae]|nr:hypothetical protein F6B41_23835 [Microbacterium lushaniae]KAA9151290.1 hypothetical protein F6B41_21045 [Microbacterium lushaniae]